MKTMMLSNTPYRPSPNNNLMSLTANHFDENLFDDFINYLDVGSPKTVETYRRELQQFFNYLNINGITQPQRADVIAFRETIGKTLKPTTVNNYLTAVKLFFRWTAYQGLYPNVADHIKALKIDRNHKKDYLTSNQVKNVMELINTDTIQGRRDYAIFYLMVTCGLRDIEVSRAKVEDMRLAGENIVLYIQGKGRQEKSDYVILPDEVEKAIRASLNDRQNITDDSPLFCSLSNNSKGKGLSVQSISSMIKTRLKKAGLNSDRLTAHSLRHTAVTLSLLGGEDLRNTRDFARHRDVTTTMIYDHSINKAKNTCSRTVNKMIFG